jgi:hypothetical protein
MVARDKNDRNSATITGAVAVLTAIAELDLEHNGHLELDEERGASTSFSKNGNGKVISWLHGSDRVAMRAINSTFKVVLSYLQNWHQAHQRQPQSLESIKSMMLLVGEAARKFDVIRQKLQHGNGRSITEQAVYRKLQDFYQTKIVQQVDEASLGRWILGLTHRIAEQHSAPAAAEAPALQMRHSIVDLESVKRDIDYELIFIRKEDGTHFLSPALLKGMKLISNFDRQVGDGLQVDAGIHRLPYSGAMNRVARSIRRELAPLYQAFYRLSLKSRDKPLVSTLFKTWMALVLADGGGEDNESHEVGKDGGAYFADFYHYLHCALQSAEYQRLVTYPPEDEQQLDLAMLALIHGFCRSLYRSACRYQAAGAPLRPLLDQLHTPVADPHFPIASQLEADCSAAHRWCAQQYEGTVALLLRQLSDEDATAFDPFRLGNWPNLLYQVAFEERQISNIYLPAPIHQEYIHKACVVEEFKGFLRSVKERGQRHLLVNLQDRTSWQERARALALEGLQMRPEFDSALMVVTLARDSEFYHQCGPHSRDNHANRFIDDFKRELLSSSSGYYFGGLLNKGELEEFAGQCIEAIHCCFFSHRNILLVEHRQAFIDLFHLFLLLKLIDKVNPESFSLTCKDGVDSSSAFNVLLYVLLSMVEGEDLASREVWQAIHHQLILPALLMRERSVQPGEIKRLCGAVRAAEFVYEHEGHQQFGELIRQQFGPLYQQPLFNGKLIAPQ